MARPLLVLAVVAIVGMTALRLVLGVAGGIFGFFFGLLIKLAIVSAIIYFGIRIVSPDTARKMREHFTGPGQ
jgi:hypothetical protein